MHKQLFLGLRFPKFLEWKDFYVSDSNIDAVKWLNGFNHTQLKLLIIYGVSGCGKTHLGNLWKKSNLATTITFKEQNFLPRDVFVMNDKFIVDDWNILLSHQEWSFHFINEIVESNKKMLILAQEHPYFWHFTLNDLKSRILTAPTIEIKSPDEELMLKITEKLLKERCLNINKEKISSYLQNIERSYSAVIELVETISYKQFEKNKKIRNLL